MYIHSIKIQNLKRLQNFDLEFTSDDGEPRMWSVLIGENGTGKSAILQAIALAAAGQLLVNGLVSNSVAHLADSRQSEDMKITALFSVPIVSEPSALSLPKKQHPRGALPAPGFRRKVISRVTLPAGQLTLRGSSEFEDEPLSVNGKDPLDEARAQDSPGWFVVGYGVNRVLPGSNSFSGTVLSPVNRMRPLFEPTQQLISTDFINLFENDVVKRAYSRILQSVLIDTDILPKDISGLELRGRNGVKSASDLVESARFSQTMGVSKVKVPAIALAHGYQSTIAWIADLVGHIVLAAQKAQEAQERKKAIDPRSFQGLVLIDEIDLYLHPIWQAKLIPALRQNFPRVQFIATTHSPVVLATLIPDEIVRLQVETGTGSVRRIAPHEESGKWGSVRSEADLYAQPDPRYMTGTEMYQEYFGVERLTLNEHGEDIRDYTALATNPYRSDYQEHQMNKLAARLRKARVDHLAAPVKRKLGPVEL